MTMPQIEIDRSVPCPVNEVLASSGKRDENLCGFILVNKMSSA